MKKITVLLLLISITVFSQGNKVSAAFQEGLHYTLADPAYATDNDQKVVIYEFFGYKCPHCSTFELYMHSLEKKLPPYAKIVRVPLGMQPSWKILAQAYYTAEELGVLGKSHQALFDALHKQRKKFRSIEDIAVWFESEYSIPKAKFLATAESFMVDAMVNKGNNIAKHLKISRTPALNINGKFVPNLKALGSNEALIDLTLFLVEKEAKSMGLTK